MVNILTGTPFDEEPRFNHRTDEVSLEFPSSAGSRALGLLALKAISWRAIGGNGVKTVTCDQDLATNGAVHDWAKNLPYSRPFILTIMDGQRLTNIYYAAAIIVTDNVSSSVRCNASGGFAVNDLTAGSTFGVPRIAAGTVFSVAEDIVLPT